MRQLTILLALVSIATVPGWSAPKENQRPYYRPKTNQTRPRQQGAPFVVVNGASFAPGISPGGLATITGQNLTDLTNQYSATSANPLPSVIANVSVTVNGVPAPLFFVGYVNGGDQINFQVPYETPVGPGAAQVTVYEYGNAIATVQTDSFTQDPGIFAYNSGGVNFAVAENGSDYTLVGPNNPVHPGDYIILYTTGLGPLTVNVQDGYGAPSSPLAYTVDPFQVFLAGEQCQVTFSGLGPGFVGVYQVNFVVPPDAPVGNLDLQIQSPYATSNTVSLPVE